MHSLLSRLRQGAVVLVAAVGLAASSGAALAAGVTFTHDGSFGSGTLDGTPIGPAAFSIVATADTNNIESSGNVFSLDHVTASITISGLGTFDFITATRTFVNQGLNIVGFSRDGLGGSDLFNGPTNGAFGTYDLSTSIGPIGGAGNILQWTSSDIVTSGGVLNLDSFFTDAQFTAVVGDTPRIPLPAGLPLLLGALVVTAGLRARRS